MPEEKTYQGIRAGDAWLASGPLTRAEAENLIETHMKGASLEMNYWLEEEADYLVATFSDRDEPVSANFPGTNAFPKGQTWGGVRAARSEKRREFPNP